jgi:hypothetical protein
VLSGRSSESEIKRTIALQGGWLRNSQSLTALFVFVWIRKLNVLSSKTPAMNLPPRRQPRQHAC